MFLAFGDDNSIDILLNNRNLPNNSLHLHYNILLHLIILYLLKNANCVLSNLQILKLLYDFEGFN